MSNLYNDIIVSKSLNILEDHSNFLISDEQLKEAFEADLVLPEHIELYASVLNKLEDNALTADDKAYICEAYTNGYVSKEAFAILDENAVVSKDELIDFLTEVNVNPGITAGGASLQAAAPKPTLSQKIQGGAKKVGSNLARVGNNVLGYGAQAVGKVASTLGAHNAASKIYGFAANRFAASGNNQASIKASGLMNNSKIDAARKQQLAQKAAVKAAPAAKPVKEDTKISLMDKLNIDPSILNAD